MKHLLHPRLPDHIRGEVLRRITAGESKTRVARELGVSRAYVYLVIDRPTPRSSTRTAYERIMAGSYVFGGRSLSQLMTGLPEQAVNWLDEEKPEGTSMVEYIRAILIDAYNDSIDSLKE